MPFPHGLREGSSQQEALCGPCSQAGPAANTGSGATCKVTESTEINSHELQGSFPGLY